MVRTKSQASIEIMVIASTAIIFLAITYLFFLNDQALVSRQTDFLQAQRNVEETAALLNAANRIEGFYAEFQVPLLAQSFYLNLTNSSVTGFLTVGAGKTQLSAPINATIYCSPCILYPGAFSARNSNKVLTVAKK